MPRVAIDKNQDFMHFRTNKETTIPFSVRIVMQYNRYSQTAAWDREFAGRAAADKKRRPFSLGKRPILGGCIHLSFFRHPILSFWCRESMKRKTAIGNQWDVTAASRRHQPARLLQGKTVCRGTMQASLSD